ncbi:hypothetical protein [Amycolatopsis sp. WGS_07]|uniref:hypothetical protein n=1 Tax=Amycolatopsis sp. WGS_07 TaxID=3076764 RepID=UPI003872DA0D
MDRHADPARGFRSWGEAPGLDVTLRGLSMICIDEQTLAVTGPVFDGLCEFHSRATLLGREPA